MQIVLISHQQFSSSRSFQSLNETNTNLINKRTKWRVNYKVIYNIQCEVNYRVLKLFTINFKNVTYRNICILNEFNPVDK